jgi:hypothetical protein
VIDDLRTIDPVGYIRRLGLQPEDSYGFVPTSVEEGASILYVYRDRPEYEERRPKLAPPIEAQGLGPVEMQPAEYTQMQAPESDPGAGLFGGLIQQAQEMQKAYGGGQQPDVGAPGDTMRTPNPEELVRLAKLRESGAISNEEYVKLVQERSQPTSTDASDETGAPSGGASIVAHRLYPGIRSRSSTRQLNRFLPGYCEAVGLAPEDTYGVFPWGTRTSSTGPDHADSTEWDDFWIVYRDRPEYETGRAAWAKEMDGKGRWPDPVIAPGVGDGPASGPRPGEVKVDKDRWPRKALVMKEKGPELADNLREKIAKRDYEPDDSFGFCPNFAGGSIYFGWREA